MTRQHYVMDDPVMTLREWRNKIEALIMRYGAAAEMHCDAGANNVQFIVTTRSPMPPTAPTGKGSGV